MRTFLSVLQDLNANRLRSTITVASIVVGVVALIGTTLVGLVAQDVFVAKEEQRTARAATLRVDFDASSTATRDAVSLWQALKARLPDDMDNPVVLWNGTGELSDGHEKVTTVLVLGRYTASRRLPIVKAPLVSTRAELADRRDVLINQQLPRVSLGAHDLAVPGSTSTWHVDVSGVVADAESSPEVYVPITGDQAEWMAFQVQAAAPTLLLTVGERQVDAARELVQGLASQLGVATIPTVARYDSVPAVRDQLGSLRTLFSAIAVVALVLSALGILNIGLASVSFRTRELAIRRALGARPADLFALVLGNALVAGFAAALAGLATTALVVEFGLPHLLPRSSAVTIPQLPPRAVVYAVAAATATAVAGAALPAWRASRIEIAGVLRD